MMACTMELLDGCPTAPRGIAPDCQRYTLLPSPSNSPRKPTPSVFSRDECGERDRDRYPISLHTGLTFLPF